MLILSKPHRGIVYSAAPGSDVRSTAGDVVGFSGCPRGYGNVAASPSTILR